MVFTVLGAVAELERILIAERVRVGLRNARAKGKALERPRGSLSISFWFRSCSFAGEIPSTQAFFRASWYRSALCVSASAALMRLY
jgi:hypothetical protein